MSHLATRTQLPKYRTLFSEERFIRAVAQMQPPAFSPLAVAYPCSGTTRHLYAMKLGVRLGKQFIEMAPFGLYACPAIDDESEADDAVQGIFNQLRTWRTINIIWNVRFDHTAIAKSLNRLHIPSTHTSTHVLRLDEDYDALLANYSAMTRNHVRRAERNGVVVRRATDEESIRAYCAIHRKLFQQKESKGLTYSDDFILNLRSLGDDLSILVAELNGEVIAGSIFFRDGDSLLYWHSAANRDHSHLFPSCAIIDHAIRLACEQKLATVNLGGSIGIDGLERFKASWGARREMCWSFQWNNPFWQFSSQLGKLLHPRRVVLPSLPPSPAHISPNIPEQFQTAGPSWSERAKLGGLNAVLSPEGSPHRNLFLHGTGSFGANHALSLLSPKSSIIDFGCGTGRFTRLFASHGHKVLGTEITPEMIAEAHKEGSSPDYSYVLTNGISIPAEDGSQDAVWCCGVLRYSLLVDNPVYDKIVAEMLRVLRPGGFVINVEMYVDKPAETFTRDFEAAGFLTREVRVLQRREGKLEQFFDIELWPAPWFETLGKINARLRYHLDNPRRPWAGLRDYFFVWQKPESTPPTQ